MREVEGTVCETVNKYLKCQTQATAKYESNVKKLPEMVILIPKFLDFSHSLSGGESGQTTKWAIFWKSEDCFLIQTMPLRHGAGEPSVSYSINEPVRCIIYELSFIIET